MAAHGEDDEEDLSKIEWGAGFGRMIDEQLPNVLLICCGFAVGGLPSYLGTGAYDEKSDITFPCAMSAIALVVAVLCYLRVRAILKREESFGWMQEPLLGGGGQLDHSVQGGTADPLAVPTSSKDAVVRDPSCLGILGLRLHQDVRGTLRLVMRAGLIAKSAAYVCFGWSLGLTTFCAYDKGHDLSRWQECYELDKGLSVDGASFFDGHHANGAKLPRVYFSTFFTSFLCTCLCVLVWVVLWKFVRQALRPPRAAPIEAAGGDDLPQTVMFVLAMAVGCIAGLGAYVFRLMIGAIHNVMFLYDFDFNYNATLHTPKACDPTNAQQPTHRCGVIGKQDWLIIIMPVLGGLVVAFLVQTWAPEAKGHGVPEVMDAIHYKEGKIRPLVAGVKILASSFSIGSGGSVGREGPIIQIGSTFGSMVGVLAGCSISQRVTLVACGAAGGIAATFNTPIGGIVFATELMLPAANSRTLMPLGITTVTATWIGRWAIGPTAAFNIPSLGEEHNTVGSVIELLSFVPFGVVSGPLCPFVRPF
jgi:hypothetical protein